MGRPNRYFFRRHIEELAFKALASNQAKHRHGMATLARKVGGMGLDSVIAMTGHKDLKLADHYSKIDGEVQKETSLRILDHIKDLGLNEVKYDKSSNVLPMRRAK